MSTSQLSLDILSLYTREVQDPILLARNFAEKGENNCYIENHIAVLSMKVFKRDLKKKRYPSFNTVMIPWSLAEEVEELLKEKGFEFKTLVGTEGRGSEKYKLYMSW